MPIVDKNNIKELKEYSEFIKYGPNTSFEQDPRWANVKNNSIYEYVYLKKDNKIYAACSIHVKKIAFGLTILYAERGPVAEINNPNIILDLIKEMKPLFKKYKAFLVKFDPLLKHDDELVKMFKEKGFFIRGRGYSHTDLIRAKRMVVVDIKDKSFEDVLNSFTRKCRYSCRKACRSEFTYTYDYSKETMDEFMEIMNITMKRDRFETRSRKYFEKILENFKEEARLYIFKNEGDLLCGTIAINYGKILYYNYAGSTDTKRELLPNHYMQCELIKWGIEEGCETYNLGSVIKEDPTDGLWRFKSGFKHETPVQELIGEIDYPVNIFLYLGFVISFYIVSRIRLCIYLFKTRILKK